jgi:hypothetical protein
MSGLVWLGILLFVVWGVLWLGFQVVGGLVHLIVVAAVIFLIMGLVRRGASAIDRGG